MKPIQSSDNAIHILLDIMAQLRDPQSGCPWDIKQTWQTIIPHTLEEVYEVADAVDRNDVGALQDELGDLLFQVVFMAQIAKDQGVFDFNDVAQGIADKMVRRHPHIFADTEYENEAGQKQAWESIKQQERHQKQQTDFFAGIPAAMPALRRSQKIQKRAAQVGFDWGDWRLVIPKVQEELTEVTEAVENGESFQRVEEEVGDVLMGASNLARQLKVDAENALRLSNNKFERRFRAVERDLAAQGITPEAADLEMMEAAWLRAKLAEKQQGG